MYFVTRSEGETEALAMAVAPLLAKGDTLLLYGEMGAGKTAFVRGLAKGLGCTESASSPTFALMHRYGGGRLPLHHFDLYRLADAYEVEDIGFLDVLDEGISAVEWPRVAEPLLRGSCVRVEMAAHEEGDAREIEIEGLKGVEGIALSCG